MLYIEDVQKKRNSAAAKKQSSSTGKGKTRQVPFVPGLSYRLLRPGLVLDCHPEEAFQKQAFTEAHLWHFQHVDPNAQRTGHRQTTKFVAALRMANGQYIRPQFKYVQMCYVNSNRKRPGLDVLQEDGTPWWTDSYLANQMQMMQSKERYKNAKRLKTIVT